MTDTDKPFIIAAKTDGNAFVPYAYATTREAALRRLAALMKDHPQRTDLKVYQRIQSGVYRNVTKDDQP